MPHETGTLLLTIGQTAAALNLGLTKTWELANAGEIPVVRLGRSVRVPRAALERWIAGRAAQDASTEGEG